MVKVIAKLEAHLKYDAKGFFEGGLVHVIYKYFVDWLSAWSLYFPAWYAVAWTFPHTWSVKRMYNIPALQIGIHLSQWRHQPILLPCPHQIERGCVDLLGDCVRSFCTPGAQIYWAAKDGDIGSWVTRKGKSHFDTPKEIGWNERVNQYHTDTIGPGLLSSHHILFNSRKHPRTAIRLSGQWISRQSISHLKRSPTSRPQNQHFLDRKFKHGDPKCMLKFTKVSPLIVVILRFAVNYDSFFLAYLRPGCSFPETQADLKDRIYCKLYEYLTPSCRHGTRSSRRVV